MDDPDHSIICATGAQVQYVVNFTEFYCVDAVMGSIILTIYYDGQVIRFNESHLPTTLMLHAAHQHETSLSGLKCLKPTGCSWPLTH